MTLDDYQVEIADDEVLILAAGQTILNMSSSMAVRIGSMLLHRVKQCEGDAEQTALVEQGLAMQDPRGEIMADLAEAEFTIELHEASDEITIWSANDIVFTATYQQAEQLAAGLIHNGMELIAAHHPGLTN